MKLPAIDIDLNVGGNFHNYQLNELIPISGPIEKAKFAEPEDYKRLKTDILILNDLGISYPNKKGVVIDPFTQEVFRDIDLVDYLYRDAPHTRPVKEDYKVFSIPKRSGGKRIIEAPSDAVKERQSASVPFLMRNLFITPFAHAFCRDRDIVTMATSHVKRDLVLAMDIADFFPTISFRHLVIEIIGLKKKTLKEKHQAIYELKHHCFDFKDGKGYRLPQGAPGSPFLSNVAMHSVDWLISKIAYNLEWNYSRYADDIVVSGENMRSAYILKHQITKHLSIRGYSVNKKKTKLRTNKQRQMVCGLIVNEKVNIPRRWRKNLRAEKFQQNNDESTYRRDTKGRESFVHMVYTHEKDTASSCDYYASLAVLRALKGTP